MTEATAQTEGSIKDTQVVAEVIRMQPSHTQQAVSALDPITQCVQADADADALPKLILGFAAAIFNSQQNLVRKRHDQYDEFDKAAFALVFRVDPRTATDQGEAALLRKGLLAYMKAKKLSYHEDSSWSHRVLKTVTQGTLELKQRVSTIAKAFERAIDAGVKPGGLRKYLVENGGFEGRIKKAEAGEKSEARRVWRQRVSTAQQKLQKRQFGRIAIHDSTSDLTDADQGALFLMLCTYDNGMAIVNGVMKHDKDAIGAACVSWGKAHEDEGDIPPVPAPCEPVQERS